MVGKTPQHAVGIRSHRTSRERTNRLRPRVADVSRYENRFCSEEEN